MQVTEATLSLMKAEAQAIANKEGKTKILVVWNVTEEGTACDFDIVDNYLVIQPVKSDYPDDAMRYLVFPASFTPNKGNV